MMRYRRLFALLGLSVALGACQSSGPAPSQRQTALDVTPVQRTFNEPNCTGDDCARVTADYVRFDNAPMLSAALEQRLIEMAGGFSDGSESRERQAAAPTLESYVQRFFAEARQARRDYPQAAPYDVSMSAKVIAEHDGLLVVELNDYVFTGGAHGMPTTAYMVFDQRQRRIVTFDDMLLPDQRGAFNAALERAYRRWLATMTIDQSQAFAAQWPLVFSDNVAPLEADVAVKYQSYDLGPYAIGQPELHIPYPELNGVFKPRYLR